jgi:hypothetical protein
VGSERKGHVYYRCATMTCPTTSVKEEMIDEALQTSGTITSASSPVRTLGVVGGKEIRVIVELNASCASFLNPRADSASR